MSLLRLYCNVVFIARFVLPNFRCSSLSVLRGSSSSDNDDDADDDADDARFVLNFFGARHCRCSVGLRARHCRCSVGAPWVFELGYGFSRRMLNQGCPYFRVSKKNKIASTSAVAVLYLLCFYFADRCGLVLVRALNLGNNKILHPRRRYHVFIAMSFLEIWITL